MSLFWRPMPAVVALSALALAACGSAGPSAQHATTTPVAAATQSQSCASQVQAWAHDQGHAQLHQLTSDETAISKDTFKAAAALRRGGSATGALARWQADATALETDAQAADSNPPPACANAAAYGTAMQDYTTAARDYLSALNDLTSGNYATAVPLITAGSSATRRGTSALGQATATVNALGG